MTLLLGNRDLNKMRISSELHKSQLELLSEVPGPYWIPEGKRFSPEMFLRELVAKQQAKTEEEVLPADLHEANTLVNRVKWMLKDTMGSDGELARRQKELQLLRGGAHVTEEAAADNFIKSVEAGGFMRDYIELGELAKVIDDTLYVHGGVAGGPWKDSAERDCVGFVPGLKKRVAGGNDVLKWLEKLNEWKEEQVKDWIARPFWDSPTDNKPAGLTGARGGHSLMHYVVPGCEPSVVMGRHVDIRGMPYAMDLKLTKKLNKAGIARIVVGHTPHGNCPTVIKSHHSLTVVMADTSFSDMSVRDNRGCAVSEVRVIRGGIESASTSSVLVRGVLQTGQRIRYTLDPNVNFEEELVGRTCGADGSRWFVKAQLEPTDSATGTANSAEERYLLCHVDGFKTDYQECTATQLQELLAPPLPSPQPAPRRTSSRLRRRSTSPAQRKSPLSIPALARPITRQYSPHLEEGVTTVHDKEDRHKHAQSVSDIKAIFADVDIDHNGRISREELKQALEKNSAFVKFLSGVCRMPLQVSEIMDMMDTHRTGDISLPEFRAYCKRRG